ncbi:MAG: divergent polysaccharide deacetylase family protein [Neptuniibacter sp.]
MLFSFSIMLLIASPSFSAAADAVAPSLVIVIDDIGDNRDQGLAAINLKGAITYAFLPHTPHSKELARKAHALGKEVILHAPMESKSGRRLGPGALEHHHDTQELNSIMTTGLDAIPHVSGMNNHMGSLLTEDWQKMSDIMTVMRQRKLFFLDSMTTSDTVAWKVAREFGVPYLIRDVFLDNERDQKYIHKQFKQALQIATRNGHAVLIGHPYPETVTYLEKVLPILETLGVKLITASELIQTRAGPRLILVKKLLEPCDLHEGHCKEESIQGR